MIVIARRDFNPDAAIFWRAGMNSILLAAAEHPPVRMFNKS
jgi:hypothetical protein